MLCWPLKHSHFKYRKSSYQSIFFFLTKEFNMNRCHNLIYVWCICCHFCVKGGKMSFLSKYMYVSNRKRQLVRDTLAESTDALMKKMTAVFLYTVQSYTPTLYMKFKAVHHMLHKKQYYHTQKNCPFSSIRVHTPAHKPQNITTWFNHLLQCIKYQS